MDFILSGERNLSAHAEHPPDLSAMSIAKARWEKKT
jgi:hypothetical protein